MPNDARREASHTARAWAFVAQTTRGSDSESGIDDGVGIWN